MSGLTLGLELLFEWVRTGVGDLTTAYFFISVKYLKLLVLQSSWFSSVTRLIVVVMQRNLERR